MRLRFRAKNVIPAKRSVEPGSQKKQEFQYVAIPDALRASGMTSAAVPVQRLADWPLRGSRTTTLIASASAVQPMPSALPWSA